MDWSRAKNLLIILLLCVNAFLLATYALRKNEARRDELILRTEVCNILSKQGINVSEEIIPLDSKAVYHAVVKYPDKRKEIASDILGKTTENITMESVVFSGDGGNIMFSGDSFSLVYESGQAIENEKQAKALAKSVASKLGMSVSKKSLSVTSGDGGYVVEVPKMFSELESFDCTAEIRISHGGSVIAHGKLSGTGRLRSAGGTTKSNSALMLDFADVARQRGLGEPITISEINLGYVCGAKSNELLMLVPTIEIVSDSGVFLLNMETGKLIAN